MADGVGAAIAIGIGIGRAADPDRIEDEQEGARHG
jgi:hypothetical protein